MEFNIVKQFKDKNLKDRLKNKDQLAFEELYDRNVDDIYRFIYFKIGQKEEAGDLSSLVFLKTWEYIQKNRIERKETLRALIYKVARNVVIDYYREKRPDNLSLDDEKRKIDIADEEQDVLGDLSRQNDYELLLSNIMGLKNEYREVLIMRFVNELSLQEIADISGKKRINIRVMLHRAIKALKEMTEEKRIGARKRPLDRKVNISSATGSVLKSRNKIKR